MPTPEFRFFEPLCLLLLLLPLAVWLLRPRRSGGVFAPFLLAVANLRPSRGPALHRLLVVLGLALLAVAAARPQWGRSVEVRSQEGRSLMLVIDLSGSMEFNDLFAADGQRSDRLAAVMGSARSFIEGRPNDRIGLVFFADRALTSCPLTYDHQTLRDFLDRIEANQRHSWKQGGNLLGDGTNIGLGLGTALRRLQRGKEDGAGRAIVLITDGKDSRGLPGWVDPIEAARHARESEVRIHAIGVGDPQGSVVMPDPFGRLVEQRLGPNALPDPQRLRAIAETSGGLAFSAGDQAELDTVFAQIDRLETSPQDIQRRDDFTDHFFPPLLLGSLFLALATLAEPRLRGGLA
jgi:Ca-activated chloride channel family protein